MVLVVKNQPANTGDIRNAGSIPKLVRSPRGGHGNPLQYSYLENSMDRGACWALVHRVAKSLIQTKVTWHSHSHTHTHTHTHTVHLFNYIMILPQNFHSDSLKMMI